MDFMKTNQDFDLRNILIMRYSHNYETNKELLTEAFNYFRYFFEINELVNQKQKTQNLKKIFKKSEKKQKKIKKLSKTSKYFDFYDDVKSGCNKIIDW